MSRLFRIWFASLVLLACLFSGADAATLLFRTKGTQFFDDSGNPLAGGKVYYYEAGTTTLQTTYSDSAGTTPNANPLTLDSAGRLTTSIYFGDSDSFSDYKELLQSSVAVTVSNWPVDNLPAATPAATAAAFAPPLLAWTQVTNAASPVTLAASDAGKAYEADTTSGNIEFDLPSAASVGDGKGFVFKKTVSANSMIIDPSGSETIDNSSTSLTVTRSDQAIAIFSNGAEWYKASEYLEDVGSGRLASTFINSLTGATSVADTDEFLMQLASAGAFRKVAATAMPGFNTLGTEQSTGSGTSFAFTGIGANAKRIIVIFNDVSLSGTDDILVQIGDSGGIENSGYVATGDIATSSTSSTSGYIVKMTQAARQFSGTVTLVRIGTLTWAESYAGKVSTSAVGSGGGAKSLSATLDRVTITRSGTDTFDGGSVNILWE